MRLLKYRFIVSVHGSTNKIPVCKYPREQIRVGMRRNRSVYEDTYLKVIIYPSDLLFTEIKENDTIEKHIMELRDMWPNWYKIQVETTQVETTQVETTQVETTQVETTQK